jgi:hypothetical protein
LAEASQEEREMPAACALGTPESANLANTSFPPVRN